MEAMGDCPQQNKEIYRYFLDLPAEITEHILLQKSLSARDVVNVLQTCGQLRDICLSNEVWRYKLRQRWPGLEERYNRENKYSWYEEFKQRARYGQEVRDLVAGLSPRFYTEVEISKEGFNDFEALLDGHAHAGAFVINELLDIVHDSQSDQNLTMKYYAEKVLRFLQQKLLTQDIKGFLQLPEDEQHLEIGAALIAQWCQPTENITINDISDQLDRLADEVRREVLKMFPNQPVNAAIANFRDGRIDQLSCEQCSQILHAVKQVMFTGHKFSGNSSNYYIQTNSYIDKVLKLKTGIPITLCIVYMAVARRLGVKCEPVNFPSHFLIRWKQFPLLPQGQAYTYIDPFNGGKFLNENQLSREFNMPNLSTGNIRATTSVQVLLRMIRNLISIGQQLGRQGDNLMCLRNALELAMIISPDDVELRFFLVRVHIHLNINLQEAIDSLHQIAAQDEDSTPEAAYWHAEAQGQISDNRVKKEENEMIKPKTRKKPKDVKYSVGLLMKHKRYHYLCVVYGWDRKCEASEDWIKQMGVHTLPNGPNQPFYNVLVEDGSSRYAAEENLDFPPVLRPIPHPAVGRYFSSYAGSHYIPNAEKQQEYPDDLEFTNSLVAQEQDR